MTNTKSNRLVQSCALSPWTINLNKLSTMVAEDNSIHLMIIVSICFPSHIFFTNTDLFPQVPASPASAPPPTAWSTTCASATPPVSASAR